MNILIRDMYSIIKCHSVMSCLMRVYEGVVIVVLPKCLAELIGNFLNKVLC